MSFSYKYLKLYLTEKCITPITQVKFPEIVDAGTTQSITLYVRNVSSYDLIDVILLANDKEISFTPAKVLELLSGRITTVTMAWKPSVMRRTALSTSVYAKFKVVKRAR